MLNKEAQQALNDFAKYVIQQSRSNLTKSKKTDSKDLYNSLGYSVDKTAKGFRLTFEMSDYGEFVDKGVKGKDPSKVSPNAKIKGQQAPNSPYRFGSGSKRGTFDKFARKMSKWAKRKNLRFRNKKGQFAKGGYDAMGYVVASNIYNRGIKPSLFFTKPFNKAFERLPQELLEAYAVGIEKQINVNLKEI